MSFAFPAGLLALLSIPFVVVFHLLRERQKSHVVSSLLPWAFLKPEVRGSRLRRIPLTWLLILDVLIAALLSLAISQPQAKLKSPFQNARHVLILIDLSTSMLAEDVLPNRITQAISEATALINNLGPRDVASVASFGWNATLVADTRRENFQELISRISSLRAGETGHNLDEAFALGQATRDENLPLEVHIFTDGAFAEPEMRPGDLPIRWHFLGSGAGNQAIVEMQSKVLDDGRTQVFARLANYNGEESTRISSILFDGIPVDSTNLVFPPETILPQTWTINGQPKAVTVALLGADSLREDDTASSGVNPVNMLRGTLVTSKESLVERALKAIPALELNITTPQAYSGLGNYDFSVFNGYTPANFPDGWTLLIAPTSSEENAMLGDFLSGRTTEIAPNVVTTVETGYEALEGVDFTGVRWGAAYELKEIPEGFDITLRAGETALLISNYKESEVKPASQVSVLLADLESGNFHHHPAFPIFFAKLLERERLTPLPDQVHTGEVIQLQNPGEFTAARVYQGEEIIYEFHSNWEEHWPPIFEAGIDPTLYRIELDEASGIQQQLQLGINAGELEEADIRPRSWVKERESADQLGKAAQRDDMSRSIDLSPWLLGLSIVVLIGEAMLAWH